MKTYEVTFKVNGNRCYETVTASSAANAKSCVQAMYPGEKIVFMGVKEVR